MNASVINNWHEANQRYLMAALGVVRAELEHHAARLQETIQSREQVKAKQMIFLRIFSWLRNLLGRHAARLPERADTEGKIKSEQVAFKQAATAMPAPSALEKLCKTFGLSSFERDVLLLCAGPDLDAAFAELCAAAQGDSRRDYPTFSLALAALPEAHWSALTPAAALRYWRLIEVEADSTTTYSRLRIDERILHYLTGVRYLDERLVGMVEPLQTESDLLPSHKVLAERLAAVWSKTAEGAACPIVQLCGDEFAGKLAIAEMACARMLFELSIMPASAVPSNSAEINALARLWNREATLSNSALLLDCHEEDPADATREMMIKRLIENIHTPLIVASRDPKRIRGHPMIHFDVRKPTPGEQCEIWRSSMKTLGVDLDSDVEALVSQFDLSAPTIHAVLAEVLGQRESSSSENADSKVSSSRDAVDNKQKPGTSESSSSNELQKLLWDGCRALMRPRLGDLAQRIEPAAKYGDLVLPEPQKDILRNIAIHMRQRLKVYETWGFAAKSARGLGLSALFAGPTGTGKTMASEVLANELRLDLYRIDLSQVVSKYIGETEKNLRRVFDAAEEGGAILLFDEADAIFGKRSEVKDSHDRYANIEISYLLQRMETYRGLAILTTNMKSALDTAFLRRIRFIVNFPFPDITQRAEIWRRIFPDDTPKENLDWNKLARLNVTGGNIRNIALNAAFLAAENGGALNMKHLFHAAHVEYAKLEKALTAVEIGDWV